MVSVICAIYVTFAIFIGNSGYSCTGSHYGPGLQVAGGGYAADRERGRLVIPTESAR